MALLRYVRNEWDRVAAWVCIGGGALSLLLGWIGVSGTAFPAEQNSYIASGGLFGVFLLGVGALLWISADLRDEWRKLDAIERRLGALAPLESFTANSDGEEDTPAAMGGPSRARRRPAGSRPA